jgi:hypothetical protein
MEWYALDTRRQLSFERKRISFEVRGFHVAVLALLAEREQGPALVGARSWTNRDWSLACGGTRGLAEKLVASGLARWDEGDLFVADYDVDGEDRVRKARESGAKGGKSRGSRVSDPSSDPRSEPHSDPPREPPTRDGTGRIREEETPEPPAQVSFLKPSEPKKPTPGSKLREVFERWFVDRYGVDYDWSAKEGTHAKSLMGKAGALGVGEVMRRAEIAAAQTWRSEPVTLGSLLSGWNGLSVEVVQQKLTPQERADLERARRVNGDQA